MSNDLGEIAAPRYEALWHRGPIGAFVADPTGKLTAVNARWTEIAGISAEQALRDGGLRGCIHPDEAALVDARWEKLVRTGERSDINFRFEHPELGMRYVWASSAGIRDGDGNITEIVGTLIDETDRRLAEDALRESEELHRLTITNLPGSAVGLYDRDMRCLLMEGIETRGMSTGQVRGKQLSELAPPEVMDSLMPGVEAALNGEEYSGEYQFRAQAETWTFHTAPYVGADDQIRGFLIVAQNITKQRAAEEERRRADKMFRAAFDSAPIGMAIIGLDQRFTQVNRALEDMLGMTEARLRAGSILDIVHPEDVSMVTPAFERVTETGAGNAEFRLLGADKRLIWVDARATLVSDENGSPLHLLAQMQDVTERRSLIERLEHMVAHDPLTGLSNRRGCETALAAQIAVNRRYGERGSLMIIDIDNFKQVNDTAGHATGDKVIVAAAHALRDRLRESDVVARLGGDEFAVVLPEQDIAEALALALELITAIGERAETIAVELPVMTASIGVTTLSLPGTTVGAALRRADNAMYQAKRAGKNRVVLYDETHLTSAGSPAAPAE